MINYDPEEHRYGYDCRWFAGCANDTTVCVVHKILGPVPACERCIDRLDLSPVYDITEDVLAVVADYDDYKESTESWGPFIVWARDPVECDSELLELALPGWQSSVR